MGNRLQHTQTAAQRTRTHLRTSQHRRENTMPEKATMERAKEDLREGKAPSTAAGEFVKEEIEHVRHGKHGVRSPQQAIAIGLSKARRAGVPLPPPKPGRTSPGTRKKAERDYERGQSHPVQSHRSGSSSSKRSGAGKKASS